MNIRRVMLLLLVIAAPAGVVYADSSASESKPLGDESQDAPKSLSSQNLDQNSGLTSKEYREALECYRKAAEQGEVTAELNVGTAYWSGKGTEKNYAEALRWYGKAADQGNATAKDMLGDAYRLGLGVPVDFAKGLSWSCAAAEGGATRAMNSCGYGLLIGG